MLLNRRYTPLPPVATTPLRVSTPVWFDLPANGRVEVFEATLPGDVLFDLVGLSGTNAADVSLEVKTTTAARSGKQTLTRTYPLLAQGGYDTPLRGPAATDHVQITARNPSATTYDTGNAGVFRVYLDYEIRPLSVVDKLYMGLPVTATEEQLASEFGLPTFTDLGLAPRRSPLYEATLDSKSVITDASEVAVVDVPAGGSTAVFEQAVPRDRVLYVTGLSVNGDDYTSADGLEIGFTREGPDEFYRLDAYGALPQPAMLPLHVPFLDACTIDVHAAQAVTDVEIRIEYAWVRRTLLEKALYGLAGEVQADDRLAATRQQVYADLQRFLTAGLPILENYDVILQRAGVSRGDAAVASASGLPGAGRS